VTPASRKGEATGARRAGAALSGGLLWVAFLPLPVPGAIQVALVLVALVPWIVVTEGLTPGRAARSGAVLGAVFWGLHLGWMLLLATRIGEAWPVFAWAGEVALLCLLWAGMGAGRAILRERGVPSVVAVAVAWVAVEWVRGALLGPLRFPWTGVALPLTRVPLLLQPAAWGGEAALALAVVAGNGLVAEAVLGRGRGSGVRAGMRVLALLAVWTTVGVLRLAWDEGREVERARVTVVQPDVPLAVRRGDGAGDRALETLRLGLAAARRETSQLVIFPETHLPFAVDAGGEAAEGLPDRGVAPLPAGVLDEMVAWVREEGRDLVVGGYLRDSRGVMNAGLRIDAEGLAGAYGKQALVPGVEWSPGGGLVRGSNPRPLDAPGRPGMLICIESAWGSLALARARAGAGWLLNVTNDAWLAETPGSLGGAAFGQHPWHLALRSVETGLGAVRVGNDGWSGTTDPMGRWVPALPAHTAGVATVRVSSLPGPTLFVRWGGWLGPLCGLLVAGAWILRRRPAPA